MVSVTKALELILDNTSTLNSVRVPLEDALGLVLAKDIVSPVNLPLFDNSAMDGFAVRSADTVSSSSENPVSLKIIGTVKAGDFPEFSVQKGEAAKIMTGAVVPEGADGVVRIEDVNENGSNVVLKDEVILSANVRFQGEEIKKGAIALEKDIEITPAVIGFLAELGLKTVEVYQPPRVSVVVTGEELADSEEELKPGKIRDTNSITLKNALLKENMELISLVRAADSKADIEKKIMSALESSDILISTGGVSVGDYDFVKEIFAGLGVEELFWGVSQRPGGPMYFGRRDDTLVFGLPGNPASSLVCYYEYVRSAIRKMAGKKSLKLKERQAQLINPIKKKAGKTHFLRGFFEDRKGEFYVRETGGQGSHMMKSFALANCFIVLPDEVSDCPTGSFVKVHLLP